MYCMSRQLSDGLQNRKQQCTACHASSATDYKTENNNVLHVLPTQRWTTKQKTTMYCMSRQLSDGLQNRKQRCTACHANSATDYKTENNNELHVTPTQRWTTKQKTTMYCMSRQLNDGLQNRKQQCTTCHANSATDYKTENNNVLHVTSAE